MAARKSRSGRKPSRQKRQNRRASARRSRDRAGPGDAIALLKNDHREVENLFKQFEKARSDDRKLELAHKICSALKTHTTIEEEIFYPAFLAATQATEIHHEAEIEHAGAKNLIAQIESAGPDDEYYDAKVSVLSEMIKHHVNEEEQRGGMFAKARATDLDLKELGRQLEARKHELLGEEAAESEDGIAATLLGRQREEREAARRS